MTFGPVSWIQPNASASHVVMHTDSQHRQQLHSVLGRLHCSLANLVPLGNRVAVLTGVWHRLKMLHRHLFPFAQGGSGGGGGGGGWGEKTGIEEVKHG